MPYKNREDRLKRGKEYAKENPFRSLSKEQKERRNISQKKYRKAHLEKVRDWERNERARRRLWIEVFKNKPCADCKKLYPSYVMQFDHKRDKKFMISKNIYNFGIKKLREEIEKCDVVCANCHAIRTWSERGKI